MADTTLASLSLTHVHYNPSDPLSHISAWLALLPQGLCIVYVTLLVTTREIEIAFAFAGQLACEALNFALKRLFKESRPEKVRALGKGYGMPSSHAQFVGFWSIYVSLWLWVRLRPVRKVGGRSSLEGLWKLMGFVGGGNGEDGKVAESLVQGRDKKEKKKEHKRRESADGEVVKSPSSPTSPSSKSDKDEVKDEKPVKAKREEKDTLNLTITANNDAAISDSSTPTSPISPAYALQLHHPHLTKAFLSFTLLTLAILVSLSRIYLSYHTVRQVYIGFFVGASFAAFYFLIIEIGRRTGYVDVLLEHPLLRLWRVRDLCCEEDLVELGWGVWEEKRRRRRRQRRKSVRFAGLPDEDGDGEEEEVKGLRGKYGREKKRAKKES